MLESEGRTMPSSHGKAEVKHERGSLSRRSYPPTNEDLAPEPRHSHDERNKTPSPSAVVENDASATFADADGASTIARSTFSSYAPSLTSEKSLLPSGHRRKSSSSQPHLQKTVGRKAFVGACNAINVVIPIDVNDEVASMHASGLAKLARAVRRKEEKVEIEKAERQEKGKS